MQISPTAQDALLLTSRDSSAQVRSTSYSRFQGQFRRGVILPKSFCTCIFKQKLQDWRKGR